MIKIIAIALIITAIISVVIFQFRPTGNIISESSDDPGTSYMKSYAEAGGTDIENGEMKQMDIIINLTQIPAS